MLCNAITLKNYILYLIHCLSKGILSQPRNRCYGLIRLYDSFCCFIATL